MSETDTPNAAPGFAGNPDYSIRLAPAGRRMRAIVAGCVILAESENVLVMREADYPPVYYFPRRDVNLDVMTESRHRTFCSFKGDASYWSIEAGDYREDNIAWSYEAPFDEMREIAGMIAFYQDRVKLEVSD